MTWSMPSIWALISASMAGFPPLPSSSCRGVAESCQRRQSLLEFGVRLRRLEKEIT